MDRPAPSRPSAGAVVLALSTPFVFLHDRYNPGVEIEAAGASIGVELSDLAILAVAVASLVSLRRSGPGALGHERAVWIAAAALLALVAGSALWGPAVTETYPFADGLVSAATFVEYAVLAPAVPLLVRSRADAAAVLGALAAVTVAAAAVAALQLVGLVGNLDRVPAGRRMPSFLGYHELAALSAGTAGVVVGLLLLRRTLERRWLLATVATAAALGVAIGGALASLAGLLVGSALALLAAARRTRIDRRRLVAAGAVVAVALGGSLALRSSSLADLIGFLGDDQPEPGRIETYSQRTVLSYIGLRIFWHHPVLGTGWQGSALEESFGPELPAARERFPDVDEAAFPSGDHPWGVQNAYVQAGADMGAAGAAALVALVAAGLLASGRRLYRGTLAAAWLAAGVLTALTVCAFELAALGLASGTPLLALFWLSLGAAVALRSVAEDAR
jgi:O-antigen ligase